jgi:4-amino-4-deoxy-L-arabinose transferase-like glycosyltransferase
MSAALDWFGILTFGLTAFALWLFWVDSYVNGMSPRVALILRDTETGYGVSFRLAAVVSAMLLTTLWVVLVRPARRSNRRAVLNWAAGVTLIWGLASTIWLPYIDSRRTYRLVAESIASQLPRTRCVASRSLGDAQRALFYYFAGIVTVPAEIRPVTDCGTLIVQYGRLAGDVPAIAGWRLTWSGARRGDRSERFAIYVKEPS